jgi:hypothetical protein
MPETDSILNKFCYTSGMDANDIGDHVYKAIETAGPKYYTIEGDFTLYDASQR